MNDIPKPEIQEEVVASPESVEKAKAVINERFSLIKKPDSTLKVLARLGLDMVARDIEANPEQFGEIGPRPDETPEPLELDPLDILRKELQLPAMPQVFLELQQAINADNTSADDLARIISQDPSLTAFLLRMVNSAFYSLPMQIDTISRAVAVVGVDQLSTLAVGTSVMSLFKDMPDGVVDMERFWKHSIAVGLIAKRLCKLTGNGDPERAFVAGLVHDIGQLVLLKAVPEQTAAVLIYARHVKRMVQSVEKQLLGFDHATIGGMLLRKWNFPFVLVNAVLDHHVPNTEHKDPEVAIVHVAEVVATILGIGSSTRFYVQPPNADAWARVGLNEEMAEKLVDNIEHELDDAFSVLIAN